MLTLLHISDLHFGPPFLPNVAEALLRSAAELSPDVIVASGDFTQRATAAQFQAARAYLDRLPAAPLVVTPGNHDVPLYRVFERLFHPYANYQRSISPELNSVTRVAGAVIVALNTAAPRTAITGGRVQRWQLDYCDQALRGAPAGAARIVVGHHHFAPAPDYDTEHDVVRRAKLALDRFTAVDVDLILGGHLHRAYIGNSLDVYPSQDRSSGIVIVQAGTATSRRGRAREREKNSFNLIEIHADQIEIVHYMYFADLAGFGPLSRHTFARRPNQCLPPRTGRQQSGVT